MIKNIKLSNINADLSIVGNIEIDKTKYESTIKKPKVAINVSNRPRFVNGLNTSFFLFVVRDFVKRKTTKTRDIIIKSVNKDEKIANSVLISTKITPKLRKVYLPAR